MSYTMLGRYYLLLASIAGVATGGIGLTALYAQAPSKPVAPAYYMADFELTDPEGLRPYSAGVAATFEPFRSAGNSSTEGAISLHWKGNRPREDLL
jgi:hypothetical protein